MTLFTVMCVGVYICVCVFLLAYELLHVVRLWDSGSRNKIKV